MNVIVDIAAIVVSIGTILGASGYFFLGHPEALDTIDP